MRKMKDSGVEWIGEIPENSEITRLKYIGEVFGRIGFRGYTQADLVPEGEGPITLSPSNINEFGMDYSKCTYLSWDKYNESPEIQIKNGDVLMVKTGSSYGKSAIVEELPMEATVNPQFIVIKNIRCNPKYLYYYMQTELFKYQVEEAVVGGTIPTMAQEKINSFYIINYNEKYSRRIVEFLDKKCAEIDALIAAKEKSNALLKEQRQSIIYEAVTKGLNPDVPMKDIGIEWIGKIPKNWNVKRIKHIGTFRNGLTYSPDNIVGEDEGTLVLRSSNIKEGKLCFDDNVFVECEIPETLKVKKGDILICSRNGSKDLIGKNAIIDVEGNLSFGAFMMIFRCNNPRYMYYILNSNVFAYYLSTFLTSTVNQLTGENFGNMNVVYCEDENEQIKIVEYLDKKCIGIDSLIQRNNTTIEKLKEYRKSIIFEAVTGKVEV